MFDRDYRCHEEVTKFLDEAKAERVGSAVLERKEIENYLLVPDAIKRAVERRLTAATRDNRPTITTDDVLGWMHDITDEFRIRVMSRIEGSVLEFHQSQGSRLDRNTIVEQFHTSFTGDWKSIDYRLARGPGKDILARLNDKLQQTMKLSLTEAVLAEQLTTATVDPYLLGLLERLNAFCAD